ncbi:MAG: molybdenum cofactor guanylyltransferase [Armatimonadetes bacterium]|nr:molybdenum cofactor guanylyltransferase [Armatimonadota bacterium]
MEGQAGTHYDIDHADQSSVLLTGGASCRMGFDKASILIESVPLAVRLARMLQEAGWEPTILGRTPLDGYCFHPDNEVERGPLAALRAFCPTSHLVFVLSCDVPLFDGAVARALKSCLGEKEAAIPAIDGRLQPLCGVYRREAWERLSIVDSARIMDWVEALDVEIVTEVELLRLGVQPDWCRGVNTPSELKTLLALAKWAVE